MVAQMPVTPCGFVAVVGKSARSTVIAVRAPKDSVISWTDVRATVLPGRRHGWVTPPGPIVPSRTYFRGYNGGLLDAIARDGAGRIERRDGMEQGFARHAVHRETADLVDRQCRSGWPDDVQPPAGLQVTVDRQPKTFRAKRFS